MTDTSSPQPRPPKKRRSGTAVLLGITGLGAMVFLGSIGAVAYMAMGRDAGEVQEGSFLKVKLAGSIPDAPMTGGLLLDPNDMPPVATEYAAVMRSAATDDRITGLHLTLNGPSIGWAGSQEIRSAIEAFRAEGKPCVAYAEVYTTPSYYLASVCDQVILAPGGITLVSGLNSSITYYAGAFEKLGVESEFEHVGDFKSAIEPYERSGPSESASEAMNGLLDSLYSQIVHGIADSRDLSPGEVRALINKPPMSPKAALKAGLVDGLAFPDQVLAAAPDLGSEDWVENLAEVDVSDLKTLEAESYTSFREYLKEVRGEGADAEDFVAVIHADGPIVSGSGDGGLFGDSMLADKPFAKWMEEARTSERVKAVVLRVNSPGGSGLASDMMWREIRRCQDEGKPVVVSMGNYAASGGYYIAAPADYIYAQPGTLTGSIGVFGGKLNLAGTYEKIGLTQHSYKRGDESDIFSGTASFSDTGREVYRTFLQDFYDSFLDRVATGREMEVSEVHKVAQGRVWTGEQAVERGLVDGLGGLHDAVAKAAELAELEDHGVERLPKPKSFFELLVEDMEQANARSGVEVTVALPGLEEALREAELLERVLAGGAAAFVPGLPQFE